MIEKMLLSVDLGLKELFKEEFKVNVKVLRFETRRISNKMNLLCV